MRLCIEPKKGQVDRRCRYPRNGQGSDHGQEVEGMEVATQPGAGGYRKVAAALLADHGIKVDVLLVSPLAAQRGSSPMYIRTVIQGINPPLSLIVEGL